MVCHVCAASKLWDLLQLPPLSSVLWSPLAFLSRVCCLAVLYVSLCEAIVFLEQVVYKFENRKKALKTEENRGSSTRETRPEVGRDEGIPRKPQKTKVIQTGESTF